MASEYRVDVTDLDPSPPDITREDVFGKTRYAKVVLASDHDAYRREIAKSIVKIAIPLEVLAGQIKIKPYMEITEKLQQAILDAVDIVRGLAKGEEK